jgi:hypothetical protein
MAHHAQTKAIRARRRRCKVKAASKYASASGNRDRSSTAIALREMRYERRELLRRIADAESRALEAETARDDVLADTSAFYDL